MPFNLMIRKSTFHTAVTWVLFPYSGSLLQLIANATPRGRTEGSSSWIHDIHVGVLESRPSTSCYSMVAVVPIRGMSQCAESLSPSPTFPSHLCTLLPSPSVLFPSFPFLSSFIFCSYFPSFFLSPSVYSMLPYFIHSFFFSFSFPSEVYRFKKR